MSKGYVKLRTLHELEMLHAPLPRDGRGWPVAAKPIELRNLPYPFTNFASISNDCDTTTVTFDEVGLAFSYVRETLALPIADSYIPELVAAGRPILLRIRGPQPPPLDPMTMSASEVKELSGNYFRKQHQGWFDTVHGFALVSSNKLPIHDLDEAEAKDHAAADLDPRPLNRRKVRTIAVGSNKFPQTARFKLLAPAGWKTPRPPRYLVLRYSAPRGQQTVRVALKVGGKLRADLLGTPNQLSVPVVTQQTYIVDLWEHIGIDVQALHDVEIEVSAVGPDGSFVEIEDIGAVGHTTAELDRMSRMLNMYNMTVSVFTSHGLGPVVSPSVAFDREAADSLRLSDLPQNPQYVVDVFRRHGIRFVNSYSNTSNFEPLHIDQLVTPNLYSDGTPFYDFTRYSFTPRKWTGGPDPGFWERNGRALNHSLNDCLGDKIKGLLGELSGKQWTGGLVYTHFYASNAEKPGDDPELYVRPFNQNARTQLTELANRYFNATGKVKAADRLFVASCATLLRLSLMKKHIGENSYYDEERNAIHVESWHDAILNEELPSADNSFRELRALTFYVRDSHSAKLFVDGRPVEALIRNPADETGRESITVADASVPLVLLGKLDPQKAKIDLALREGTLKPRAGDGSGVEFTLNGQNAVLSFKPKAMQAANYQALLIETRRTNPAARYKLTLTFADGRSMAFSEFDDETSRALKMKPWNDTSGRVDVVPFYRLLEKSTADLKQLMDTGPGPGVISEVKLEVRGAAGDSFSVGRLYLLRDTETLVDPKGSILGGQVSKPDQIRRIVLKDGDKEYETKPTMKGLYFFEARIRRGSIVEVFAETRSGEAIEPLNGRLVEIITDKTDVDF